MSRRRPPRQEPLKCICEPGGLAPFEHAKPGKKAPAHLNPACPHSELANTTAPAKPRPTLKRLRLQ